MPIRAAVMTAPNQPIEIRQIDDPIVESGGVLIETVASEVCGTDVHLLHGKLAGVPYPIIPGHVSVGRVLEAPDVKQDALGEPLAGGDLVTFLDVHEICGQCYHCTVARQPNRCPTRKVYGITYSVNDGPFGGWAERIYLQPGMRILKLAEGLGADDVIGGGCGLFTGFAAVYRSDLEMGDAVLVQGAGPVGLSAAAFASLRGAGMVIMIGAPEARLDLGRRLGVDVTLDLTQTTTQERKVRIMELTHGRGVDVVLEASGNPGALPEAFSVLRDGGAYVVAGHYTDAGPVEVNPHTDINRKHIRLLGQWGTEFHHLVGALRLLGRHRERLPFADVIGARYDLAGADQALADVAALRVTKAIITP
jgi:threonine dehydrogenase-like Zn-dependent dehydrogenase